MLKKHGCTVPWMPDPIICTPKSRRGTQEEVLLTYQIFMKSGKITDLCPMPCGNMKFVVGYPDIGTDQVSCRIYSNSMYQTFEVRRGLTLSSLKMSAQKRKIM